MEFIMPASWGKNWPEKNKVDKPVVDYLQKWFQLLYFL